MGSLERF